MVFEQQDATAGVPLSAGPPQTPDGRGLVPEGPPIYGGKHEQNNRHNVQRAKNRVAETLRGRRMSVVWFPRAFLYLRRQAREEEV